MISVIICSSNSKLLKQISNNIQETIGFEYEILVRDNTISTKGLCEVYNNLATRAKGEYLCFLHEDVSFDTLGWGELIVKKLKEPKTGVIGFAGALNITGLPYWYDYEGTHYYFIQMNKNGEVHHDFTSIDKSQEYDKVTIVDGMFLACRRDVWEKHRFDALNFKKFHIYDIDFSFNVSQDYTNYVCNCIIMRHYSLGNITEEYYKGLLAFITKWNIKTSLKRGSNTVANNSIIYLLLMEMKYKAKLSYKFIIKYLQEVGLLNTYKDVIFVNYCLVRGLLKKIIKG